MEVKTGPKIIPLCRDINLYLDVLHSWFQGWNLQISAPKSAATLFTTFSNKVNMDLPIQTLQGPKILGVKFDPMLSFKHHVKDVKQKLSARNNVMKVLTRST